MGEYKSRGGKLVKVIISIDEGRIRDIVIMGDFFIEPPDAVRELCEKLRNVETSDYNLMTRVLEDYVKHNNVMLLGVTVNDFIEAIKKAFS
ncbi:MAG: lipoate protein ligase C-terminal domain-containing protein [Candidatus Nezhaarchaeales archaeon]